MINKTLLGLAGLLFTFLAGCGPTFDPGSLVASTRVVGARVQVEGAPDRASPRPGETASLTWLITAPGETPPLRWTFAVCAPVGASLTCGSAPLATFEGTGTPRVSFVAPALEALGAAKAVVVYGRICAGVDAAPTFDPQRGVPGCTGGGGTTVSVRIPVQQGDDANHNPTADRAFTFDGQAWPALAAAEDPCVVGPRVPAGPEAHVIGNVTDGGDREVYVVTAGDPPVGVPTRESLQVSQLTTAGELKSQFSFVEATDTSATTAVDVTWESPEVAEVPMAGLPVTFTFVLRDSRGGTDWTTRAVCVTR